MQGLGEETKATETAKQAATGTPKVIAGSKKGGQKRKEMETTAAESAKPSKSVKVDEKCVEVEVLDKQNGVVFGAVVFGVDIYSAISPYNGWVKDLTAILSVGPSIYTGMPFYIIPTIHY
jgi:hypothetical protein